MNDSVSICLCLMCDVSLTNNISKYCSAKCRKRYNNYKNLSKEELEKKKDMIKISEKILICKNCDIEYKPKLSNQINYCSRRCGSECYSRIRCQQQKETNKKLREDRKINCLTCNKIIPQKSIKYCNPICGDRYISWKNLDQSELEKKLLKAQTFGEEISCLHCDKMFIPDRINNFNFCSRKCHSDYGANIIGSKKKDCRNYLKDEKTKAGKCENCDESNILLLEFAHFKRIGKVDVHECFDMDILKKEMLKGRWLCILCHRIETYNEIERKSLDDKPKGYNYIVNKKLEIGKCQLCNIQVTSFNVYCFDFDHLDQSTKLFNVSQLWASTITKIQIEIDKCRLLCCKCHRLHSIKQEKENREKKINS